MELVSVDSAAATATSGVLSLVVTADLGDDAGPQQMPYGWAAGDPYGLGPQLDAWFAANPNFPVGSYTPPVISADQVDVETNRRMTLVTADAMMRFQVLGSAIPASVKTAAQAIDAAGVALKAMQPIPADYTDDKWWPA